MGNDKESYDFKKEKQKIIYSNLLHDPASRQYQEEFENELQIILSKSNGIPKELTFVLKIMSVDVAILETIYESYVSIKYKHTLAYISWNEAAVESDADHQEKIRILENKLRSLSEKVIKMLNTKKQSTPE